MKRIIAVILAVVMVVSLAACGNGNDGPSESQILKDMDSYFNTGRLETRNLEISEIILEEVIGDVYRAYMKISYEGESVLVGDSIESWFEDCTKIVEVLYKRDDNGEWVLTCINFSLTYAI